MQIRTNITVTRLAEAETERLIKMEEILHKRVVGQEQVHTKNILPKHRIQSRFRPIFKAKKRLSGQHNGFFSPTPRKVQ